MEEKEPIKLGILAESEAGEKVVQEMKPMFQVIVSVSRDNKIDVSVTGDENPPLQACRGALEYALNQVNDRLVVATIDAFIKQAAQTKLMRPGFRPTTFLKGLFSKNGKT